MPCNRHRHLRLDKTVDQIAQYDPRNLNSHISRIVQAWNDKEVLLARIREYDPILNGWPGSSLIDKVRAANKPTLPKKRQREEDTLPELRSHKKTEFG